MSDYIYALGRAAVAVVFIMFGVKQFSNIAPYISNTGVGQGIVHFSTLTNGMLSPTVIAYAVATIDLVGGIMVLIGYKTRWAALVLFVFTGLTIYFTHHFWDMSGAARSANEAHAYKNLAIMGALLMLAAMGAGRISIDGRAKPAWN